MNTTTPPAAPNSRTNAFEAAGAASWLARRLAGGGSARFAELMQRAERDLDATPGGAGRGPAEALAAEASPTEASSPRADKPTAESDATSDVQAAPSPQPAPERPAEPRPMASAGERKSPPDEAADAADAAAAAAPAAAGAAAAASRRAAAARETLRAAADGGLSSAPGPAPDAGTTAHDAAPGGAGGATRRASAATTSREAGEGVAPGAGGALPPLAEGAAADAASSAAAAPSQGLAASAPRETGLALAATGPLAADGAQGLAASLATERAAPGAGAAADPAPTPSFWLEPTLDSPDFAPALGAQLTAWARDGVQVARLELNPRDLGPVSVQIQLEGQQARVDFGADQALTREALEQAFPQLATAMQAGGLTLSGGGVSQHGRGGTPRDTPGSRGGMSRSAATVQADDAAHPGAGRALRDAPPRRLLDLYA